MNEVVHEVSEVNQIQVALGVKGRFSWFLSSNASCTKQAGVSLEWYV